MYKSVLHTYVRVLIDSFYFIRTNGMCKERNYGNKKINFQIFMETSKNVLEVKKELRI